VTETYTRFMPIVHDFGIVFDAALLRDADRLAEEAMPVDPDPILDPIIDTHPTRVQGLYVCPMPVARHQDLDGALPDMLVRGLVLRSDGHRLHSERLDAAGVTEGIALVAGSFYELDPYDFHWTTVPKGPEDPLLVFYVEGDLPDERTPRVIADEMLVHLMDEIPYMANPPGGRGRKRS
jgi:hypothetical protein